MHEYIRRNLLSLLRYVPDARIERQRKGSKWTGRNVPQLQRSWEELLQMFGIEQAQARTLFTTLAGAYSSPGRVYHTLDHIQAVLGWIETLQAPGSDVPTIQLAAWFHDSIYDTHASDNEEQSASYMQNMLASIPIPPQILQSASQMILSTKTHLAEASVSDCSILLDADLAILGASVQNYDIYAQAIRQEYGWVPERSYRTGRIQVLQSFLQRARIYWTEPMYTSLEVQARANMQREVASLSIAR